MFFLTETNYTPRLDIHKQHDFNRYILDNWHSRAYRISPISDIRDTIKKSIA